MFDPAAALARLLEDLDRDPDFAPHDAGHNPARLRARLVPGLRAVIEAGRADAEARLMKERDGTACARRISGLMDAVIRAIHDAVSARLPDDERVGPAGRLAVVATGGYGRGTLAPGSDIDLLFLMPAGDHPANPRIAEAILYALWDLKLKVGHATRTVEECLREAKADMTIRTAVLEARHLFGQRALFEELVTRFDTELAVTSAAEFVDAKLRERDGRVGKAGASRYLVEPNVKDGKGGLRDLNTLFWIAKYVYRLRDPAELVPAGLFTADEFRLFERCEEFLWRVRCHMHFVTGRPEERLSFGLQQRLAPHMGYAPRAGLTAVERFMKAYFLVAKDVGDLTAIVCAALEARHAKRPPALNRFFGRLRMRWRGQDLGADDFIVENGRINLHDDAVFERDPVNLIRLFRLADEHNLPVHPDATRLAQRSLHLVGPSLRADPEANALFLAILTSRNAPEVILRRMNEIGVLGRFIPAFGRVVAMMQFNMYHHFTVDEHLLRTVGVLAEIDAGRLREEHPLANQVIGAIRHRRALYVAVFLHDIAKGRPQDHSEAGGRLARRLGPRFGLDAAETETVAWLVTHHLLMSMTAQSRDLSDRKTIESFAAVVQTVERLQLLMILTIADIKAVGPGVWTGWKGALLRTLYYETERLIGGGDAELARGERVRLVQMRLREELSDWEAATFDAYAARHFPAYWLKADAERQVKNARFVRAAEKEGQTVATDFETDRFRGVTELTVYSPDHPRLLAILTGACAASGGNIVDAQIFTTTDGFALDTILLSRAFERDDDELRRAERIALAVTRALKGEVRIADLVESRHPRAAGSRTFAVAPELSIDNTLSGRETVLEIAGLDRPGLLYDLTTALSRLNLNITSAHVATFGERAVDVFYVTDLTGTKVTQPGRQTAIRRAVMEVLGAGAEPDAAAGVPAGPA